MTLPSKHKPEFATLIAFLSRIPAVETNEKPWGGFGSGRQGDAWWIKFSILIDHALAWHAIQELAFVLNGLSLIEPLQTVFKPVSPPPNLNGGPREYLSWVIECADPELRPEDVAEWLEGRLPNPVDDPAAWPKDE